MKYHKSKLFLLLLVFIIIFTNANSQTTTTDSTFKRCFVGNSGFVLSNLIPNQKNPPHFYQLNFGYWLTQKDVISIEAITWTYRFPLGIPYGSSFESEAEAYPGKVKGFGMGIAYQRFLWKGLYSAVHATAFSQKYFNKKNEKIQKGFQLFTALRAGYHIEFFKNRFFIEPSIAATYWPVNTNVPASFAIKENKWHNYFLVEPGLHFGFKF